MSEAEIRPSDSNGEDDEAAATSPDPDIEAAMSQALAPVVARAANEAKPMAADTEAPAATDVVIAAPPPNDAPVADPDIDDAPAADAEPSETPVAKGGPAKTAPSGENKMSESEAKPVKSAPEPDAGQVVSPTPVAASTARPAAGGSASAGGAPSARNRIYDHLVEGEDDVIGLITYSLYERDRRDWLQQWQRQHGTEPTAEQYEAFIEAQLTFAQRDRYRTAARQVLDAYASVAVDLERPVIIREGVAGRVEEAAKRVEGSGRWWRQLPAAIAGGAIMAVVLVAIIAILVAAGVDVAGYLGFEAAGG